MGWGLFHSPDTRNGPARPLTGLAPLIVGAPPRARLCRRAVAAYPDMGGRGRLRARVRSAEQRHRRRERGYDIRHIPVSVERLLYSRVKGKRILSPQRGSDLSEPGRCLVDHGLREQHYERDDLSGLHDLRGEWIQRALGRAGQSELRSGHCRSAADVWRAGELSLLRS